MALTLILARCGIAHVINVKGAFLSGKIKEDGEKITSRYHWDLGNSRMPILFYCLKKCLYGLKQAATAFYRKLLVAASNIGLKRSSANPCRYY